MELTAKQKEFAKKWIETHCLEYIRKAHEEYNQDPSRLNQPEITVAALKEHIEGMNILPTYYSGLDYAHRYSLINETCKKLVRHGKLETGTTINTKHREAACYRPFGWMPIQKDLPSFRVRVAEGELSEEERKDLEEFLRRRRLEGVKSMTIEKG